MEAKWLRNFVVADIENRIKDYKYKEVEIKTPEGFEKREIKNLSSQMKQEIIDQIKDDLKSLKKSKEKGNKVGKLKFKSEVRTISLKQYGVTYFRRQEQGKDTGNKEEIPGFRTSSDT